jgi:hypothetical protein
MADLNDAEYAKNLGDYFGATWRETLKALFGMRTVPPGLTQPMVGWYLRFAVIQYSWQRLVALLRQVAAGTVTRQIALRELGIIGNQLLRGMSLLRAAVVVELGATLATVLGLALALVAAIGFVNAVMSREDEDQLAGFAQTQSVSYSGLPRDLVAEAIQGVPEDQRARLQGFDGKLSELKGVSGINPEFIAALQRCERARQDMIKWRQEYTAATDRAWAACAARNVKPKDCPQSPEAAAAASRARAADNASMTCNKDSSGSYVPAFAAATGSGLTDEELRRSLVEYGESQKARFEESAVSWQRTNNINTTAVTVTALQIQPYPDAPNGIYHQVDAGYPYSGSLRFELVETQNGRQSRGFRVVQFLHDGSRWMPRGDSNAECVGYFLGEGPCR